ncbi:MAG: hypothetical protein K1000chlam3_00415 [Chlamydiae bacterium]|nr:hypothetical protein [Chlamydiota bacterium]
MTGLTFDPSACQKLAFKPSLRCLAWANEPTEQALRSHWICSRSNSLLNVMDMPTKVSKLGKSIVSLSHYGTLGEYIERIINVFKKFTSIIGIFVSGIQIAHEEGMILLTSYQFSILDTIGFVGSSALFLKSMTGIKKNFGQLMSSQRWGYAFNLALLKLIGRICGLVTGIFGMITFAFGGGIHAKWVMLGISTISLSMSISKYYFISLYPKNNLKQGNINNIML